MKDMKEKLFTQVQEALTIEGSDYTKYDLLDDAIEKIVSRNIEAKKGLHDVLSKHPNWCEEDLCIKMPYELKRVVDLSKVKALVYDLAYERILVLSPKDLSSVEYDLEKMRALYCDIADCVENNKTVIDKSMTVLGRGALNKQLIKALREILPNDCLLYSSRFDAREVHDNDKLLYVWNYGYRVCYTYTLEQFLARLSDLAKEYTTKVTKVFSIHPCDTLLMSYGNSWSSCQSYFKLNHPDANTFEGCYRLGLLSYLADEVTMVVYTLNQVEEVKEPWRTPKVSRHLLFLDTNNKQLLCNKEYPKKVFTDNTKHSVKFMSELAGIDLERSENGNLLFESPNVDIDVFFGYQSEFSSSYCRHYKTLGNAYEMVVIGGDTCFIDDTDMVSDLEFGDYEEISRLMTFPGRQHYCQCCDEWEDETRMREVEFRGHTIWACEWCLNHRYTYLCEEFYYENEVEYDDEVVYSDYHHGYIKTCDAIYVEDISDYVHEDYFYNNRCDFIKCPRCGAIHTIMEAECDNCGAYMLEEE